MRTARPPRSPFLLIAAFAGIAASCAATTRRDPLVPAREAAFDDSCHLQAYFDERRAAHLAPPTARDESRSSDGKDTIGEGTYELADPMLRRRFAQLLRDEYSGIDRAVIDAANGAQGEVTVHVRWWMSTATAGSTRRLRARQEIQVVADHHAVDLPMNVCVADLLFGDQLYAARAKYMRGEVDRETDHLGTVTDEDLGLAPAASGPTPAASASAPATSASPSASATGAMPPKAAPGGH